MKRAYRVTWGGISGIIAAESHDAAKAGLMRGVQDCYGNKVSWKTLRARRAPEHDAWAEVDRTGRAMDERFLPKPSTKGST